MFYFTDFTPFGVNVGYSRNDISDSLQQDDPQQKATFERAAHSFAPPVAANRPHVSFETMNRYAVNDSTNEPLANSRDKETSFTPPSYDRNDQSFPSPATSLPAPVIPREKDDILHEIIESNASSPSSTSLTIFYETVRESLRYTLPDLVRDIGTDWMKTLSNTYTLHALQSYWMNMARISPLPFSPISTSWNSDTFHNGLWAPFSRFMPFGWATVPSRSVDISWYSSLTDFWQRSLTIASGQGQAAQNPSFLNMFSTTGAQPAVLWPFSMWLPSSGTVSPQSVLPSSSHMSVSSDMMRWYLDTCLEMSQTALKTVTNKSGYGR